MTRGAGGNTPDGDKAFDADSQEESGRRESGKSDPDGAPESEPRNVSDDDEPSGEPAPKPDGAREVTARDEMDWMMTASAAASGFRQKIPDEADEAADSDADTSDGSDADAAASDPPDGSADHGSGSQDDAEQADAPDAQSGAPDTPTEAASLPATAARFDEVVSVGEAANERPVRRRDEATHGQGAPDESSGSLWLWLGAAAALGAVAFFWLRPAPQAQTPAAVPAVKTAVPAAKAKARDVEAPPTDVAPANIAPVPTPPPAETDPPGLKDPPSVPTEADPREPPAGTPPEIAAVFRKLPVSPADRAPVGGVGASGVHIDGISMGAGYDNGQCTGESKRFSVSTDSKPSVCVRVVHQRQKEELVVQWEKKGGATRRGKLHVKALHAYRTRAYLMLRSEYIGDWTVRISSQDGVELAAYDFSVEP